MNLFTKKKSRATIISREGNSADRSMLEKSHEEKLDEVLRFLSNQYYKNGDTNNAFVDYSMLWNHMDSRSIFETECMAMVRYLARDGKIDVTPSIASTNEGPPSKVRLNFEGSLFFHDGGYATRRRRLESSERRIRRIECFQIVNAVILIVLTALLIVATALPSIDELGMMW